jgi:hypothetical protein
MHPQEAEKFYRDLAIAGHKVRVGVEASGQAGWFEQLVAEQSMRQIPPSNMLPLNLSR